VHIHRGLRRVKADLEVGGRAQLDRGPRVGIRNLVYFQVRC
jgi:hypothetical protein